MAICPKYILATDSAKLKITENGIIQKNFSQSLVNNLYCRFSRKTATSCSPKTNNPKKDKYIQFLFFIMFLQIINTYPTTIPTRAESPILNLFFQAKWPCHLNGPSFATILLQVT